MSSKHPRVTGPLRTPIKDELSEPTSDASIDRMWARIDARQRTVRIAPRRMWVLPAAAALFLTVVSGVFARPWLAGLVHRSVPSATPSAPGPTGKVTAVGPAQTSTSESVTEPVVSAAEVVPTAHPRASAAPTTAASWRRLAAQGENERAYAELGRGGIAQQTKTASVEELFALADVARLSGHAAEAVDPLERIVEKHSSDARAPLAALTLGRIQLRSIGDGASAARTLKRAIDLGIPSDLSEEARALLAEAQAKDSAR